MKKLFLLAAVVLSLFLLGYGILWPCNSAAMPIPQEDTPILILDKGGAEIVTDLDGDGKVDPGDTIKYTISYSNTGQITVANVILVDDYGEAFIESVANITGGGKDDGNTITWELGTLASGEGGSISYEATLKDVFSPGSVNVENTATIGSDETDPVSVTSPVLVEVPNLTIRKGSAIVQDLGVVGVIDGGDTIKYVVTYKNIGGIEATNVIIVDNYGQDSVASIANISHQGVNDGKTITWDLGTVEAGGEGQVTYEAKLKDSLDVATDVKNQVIISSDGVEPVETEAIVRVEVAPTPTPVSTATPVPVRETTKENVLKDKDMQWLGYLVFGLGAVGLGALVWAATTKTIEVSDEEGLDRIRLVQEGVCVVLIAVAVVILRLTNCITEEGTASILSGIIGYVLGRATVRRK